MNSVRANLYRLDESECDASTSSVACECAPIHARNDAVDALTQLLRLPLRHGESASGLLVGAPGQGKTVVLRRALHALRREFGAARLRVVELHGAVHTEERNAVDSIATQLGVVFDDRLGGVRTLAVKLQAIAEHLKATGKEAVVFVLHDYDRFADRSQQTLLYNLYDFAHLGVRAAVLGVTPRFDSLERLEKRIRSRSGLRQIVLTDYRADDIWHIVRGWLTTTNDGAWNDAARAALADAAVVAAWQRVLDATRDLRLYQHLVLAALASMQMRGAVALAAADLCAAVAEHVDSDEIDATIDSLSRLELSVLRILTYVASRQEDSLLPQHFTFRAFLGHYREIVTKYLEWGPVRCEEPAVRAAFERLLDAALLISTDSRAKTRAVPLEKQHVQLTVTASELEVYFGDRGRAETLPTFLTRPGSYYV
jgi:Cdc6-like AAA superfamily ATPase